MGLIWVLQPWLARYATVPPNPRSSHYEPTPQGAGVAVVLATLAVTWGIGRSLSCSACLRLGLTFSLPICRQSGGLGNSVGDAEVLETCHGRCYGLGFVRAASALRTVFGSRAITRR
jgi:hypothetical protein